MNPMQFSRFSEAVMLAFEAAQVAVEPPQGDSGTPVSREERSMGGAGDRSGPSPRSPIFSRKAS